MDPLERELDGEGRRGIENTPKGLEGGGVEVIMRGRQFQGLLTAQPPV